MGRTSWQQLIAEMAETAAADILDGIQQLNASGGPITLITIPAGRTWVGTIAIQVTCENDAAVATLGSVGASIATAGAGVTPAATNLLTVTAYAGKNAAGGTVGTSGSAQGSIEVTVIAPAGNSVTLTVLAAVAASNAIANFSAVGALL
jgi:hypothetical protein